ncbi:MAG: nucleotidyltransferase family protein [Deinococcus sp.]|nr:nucleotidyltransferase family protein [Deinococcus sp.]
MSSLGAGKARVAALILAAGESRRMGFPKALLRLGAETFLGRLLRVLAAAGIQQRVVVLGAHAQRIRASVDLSGAQVVENPDYALGQLSSLQVGLRALGGNWDGVLMALVDHPMLTSQVVAQLLAAYSPGDAVVVPVYAGRRGHPVLFSASLIPELLAAPLDQGARGVVRSHAAALRQVPVGDPGVLADIDTPLDYRRLVG